MKNFLVFLHGKNLMAVTRSGEKDAVCFFVAKRVEAETEQKAKHLAIKAVLADGYSHSDSENFKSELLATVVHELLWSNKMRDVNYVFY